jgi:putative transposase
MPRQYSSSVRRQIVARLRSGEPVVAVAAETGICQATLFRCKRQVLIDAGLIEGTPSVEADELAAAHKRITQLEAELVLTRDACELFDEQAVVPPKRRRAIAEGLIARGHSARSACRITGLARSLLQYHRRRPVPDREVRRLIVADTITRRRWPTARAVHPENPVLVAGCKPMPTGNAADTPHPQRAPRALKTGVPPERR